MNTLGEQIRYHRKLQRLSQEDLAHEMDISVNSYSKIERNITDINWSRVLQIAKILKITVLQLLTTDKDNFNEIENLKKIITEKDKQILILQGRLIQALDKISEKDKSTPVHKKQAKKANKKAKS